MRKEGQQQGGLLSKAGWPHTPGTASVFGGGGGRRGKKEKATHQDPWMLDEGGRQDHPLQNSSFPYATL